MKCIVIETSPERIAAKPVTNEDETPHIYATMSEARAELKANGYSYNRANKRYYIAGTDYRAYIISEDNSEFDAIMERTTTAAAEQSAAEAAARQQGTFEDVETVDDMGQFESWEAEDYGIIADKGFPFYATVRNGHLLSIVHQDDAWSSAIYGCTYGDCLYFTYADSAQAALDAALKAAESIV